MDLDESHLLHRLHSLQGHTETAWTTVWNPQRPLLASCSADKTIRLYSYSRRPSDGQIQFANIASIDTGHQKTVRTIAWAPSGDTLAAGSFDANVTIWEEIRDPDNEGAKSGEWECAASLDGHENECKCIAFSICSDGDPKLATCSRDKTVWIWEAHSDDEFECIAVFMEHSQDVKYVAWHPKEEILASASYDDTIKLYIDDPSDDWYCFQTLQGHASTVWSLAWSPCGRYIASASDDKTIRIWGKIPNNLRWETVAVIQGHNRSIYSVSWGLGKGKPSSSLGWLASAGGDGVLRVWDISEPAEGTRSPVYRLLAQFPEAHGVHDLNYVAWCPREGFEDLLATAGDDGLVNIWKVEER